jgi:PadR family transcriptional regulator PadR
LPGTIRDAGSYLSFDGTGAVVEKTLAGFFPLHSKGKDGMLPMYSKGSANVERTRLELVRGTLDILILKSLVWSPLHGYAITSLIRRQSDEALLVEEGTLYPALWRLESKGLIEAEWGLSDNNRKAKYYKLTGEGRRYLRAETRTWEAYAEAVAKILGATRPPTPETS